MTIKAGIRAVVVNTYLPEGLPFLGEVCEVLGYYKVMTDTKTGKQYDMWFVSFSKDMPWPEGPDAEGVWPDEWLQPISPNESAKSTTTQQGREVEA
jgi:hypothetical protein